VIERYLETRVRKVNAPGLLSDVVRHLHARQHLGVALVITQNPESDRETARRLWHKLTRALQDKRASTISAEDILRLTSTITHMQRAKFAVGRPQDRPGAQVYFVNGSDVGLLPGNCLSAYVVSTAEDFIVEDLIRCLPCKSLVIDYVGVIENAAEELKPRSELERYLSAHWDKVAAFLSENGITAGGLSTAADQSMSVSDGVLDSILSRAPEFSVLAEDFLRALALARPLRFASRQTRNQYEDLVMLVSRVDALTPGKSNDRALDVDFDDSFALRDEEDLADMLADIIGYQVEAGRINVAMGILNRRSGFTD
jgi:hypothetical protein